MSTVTLVANVEPEVGRDIVISPPSLACEFVAAKKGALNFCPAGS